jgi:hypothetical protein
MESEREDEARETREERKSVRRAPERTETGLEKKYRWSKKKKEKGQSKKT